MEQMERIVFNDYVDATLAGFFMFVVLTILVFGVRTILAARASGSPSAHETPFVAAPAAQA
jgi:carbon starvation protein